jgi:hypothetical protein
MGRKFGFQGAWQYLVEDVPGSTPTSQMYSPGLVTGETPIRRETGNVELRSLKLPSATEHRTLDYIKGEAEIYSFGVTYIPLKELNTPHYLWTVFHNLVMNASGATTTAGKTYGTGVADILDSFTVYKKKDDKNMVLKGAKIDRMTVVGSVGQPVTMTAEGFGLTLATTRLTNTEASALNAKQAVMFSDASVTINATLATFISGFQWSIGNGLESKHYTGARAPNNIAENARDLDIQLTMDFRDYDEYTDIINDQARRVRFGFGGKYITFVGVKWDVWEDPGDPLALLQVTLRGKATTCYTT